MKRALKLLPTVVVIALAAVFFYGNREKLADVLNISALHIVGLALISVITRYLIGIRLKLLTRPLGAELSHREAFGLSIVQGYLNAIFPKAGTAAIAYYLKQVRDFAVNRFFSMLGGGFIVSGIVGGAVGLAGTLIYMREVSSAHSASIVQMGFAVLLCSCLVIMLVRPWGSLNEEEEAQKGAIRKVIGGWWLIRREPRLIMMLMAVELATLLSFGARYWIAFRAFSVEAGFFKCLILAPIAHMSFMLNITPAGMGVREIAIGVTSALIGSGRVEATSAAALDTAVSLGVMLLVGPPVNYFIMKRRRGEEA